MTYDDFILLGSIVRKKIVLDGPTGLWDTPVQAANSLQDFLRYKACLKKLKCNTLDPILLGEGAGVGWLKGIDKMKISEGSTLYDLVQAGVNNSHAAVGVVVRLRKELSDVKDIPVLIAIDQYNSWFTFSEYEEPVTVRSCQPVHARELATVGAFSHSTAVGKLRQELPFVPTDARINFPRYNLDEAASVCHYYLRCSIPFKVPRTVAILQSPLVLGLHVWKFLTEGIYSTDHEFSPPSKLKFTKVLATLDARRRLVSHDAFSEENWKKIYYLSNGNGMEMRYLVPFMRGGGGGYGDGGGAFFIVGGNGQ
ncbi:unnamed protein product [Fraxinus pennsylvanica]|uniref:Small ribosomal subunit protein mS29 n=1 Tax=Fraxinus pennsylvanica TaxID=56036 RepID=A0AAD2A2U3_9LAMI|nr:unnamed protein product [Fraxinus pennsylvanica]